MSSSDEGGGFGCVDGESVLVPVAGFSPRVSPLIGTLTVLEPLPSLSLSLFRPLDCLSKSTTNHYSAPRLTNQPFSSDTDFRTS
jgi:hypothetical protein